MNVEKRLKEIGLQSYGSQAINLTVEYGWIRPELQAEAEYRPTVKLFMWFDNGRSIQCEGKSIEHVLDKAEERLDQYRKDNELEQLRHKLSKIHQLSGCPA